MALTKDDREHYDGWFPLDGTEYFTLPSPFVDGLMPKFEYTLLTGQPKVGKSTFGAHLNYSAATHESFFGREVTASGIAIYIAYERAYQTQQRLYKLFELGERSPQNVILFKPQEWNQKSLFFNREDDVTAFIERIERSGITDISAVTVDSLANSLDGSDSDTAEASKWCDGFQRVLEHFETTGLVLHHETKASEGDSNSKTAYRGSSVFYARSGQWLRAMHKGKGVKLFAEQGNFGADWKQEVGFNDFGLYTDSMPALSGDKRPTFNEFFKARLIENPMVTRGELAQIIREHPETEWDDAGDERVSQAAAFYGSSVVRHKNPENGREKLYEWIG